MTAPRGTNGWIPSEGDGAASTVLDVTDLAPHPKFDFADFLHYEMT